MKNIFTLMTGLLLPVALSHGQAQTKPGVATSPEPKVEVYYFHPNSRCPIDQAIEENTVKLIYGTYGREIKAGTIKFDVINTDDKSREKTVSRFEINAQALYIVKWNSGKEIRVNLTDFAFSFAQSNPDKFRTGLKDEIDKALKPEPKKK